jgi:TPR repeat protein
MKLNKVISSLYISTALFAGKAAFSSSHTAVDTFRELNDRLSRARFTQETVVIEETSKQVARYLAGKSQGINLKRQATEQEREEGQKLILQRVIAEWFQKKEGQISLKAAKRTDPDYVDHMAAIALYHIAPLILRADKAGFLYSFDEMIEQIFHQRLAALSQLKIKHKPLCQAIYEKVQSYTIDDLKRFLSPRYIDNYRALARQYPDVPEQWAVQIGDILRGQSPEGTVEDRGKGLRFFHNKAQGVFAVSLKKTKHPERCQQSTEAFSYRHDCFLPYADYEQLFTIHRLPPEVLLDIMHHLEAKDLGNLSRVSRMLRWIAQDRTLILSPDYQILMDQIITAPSYDRLIQKAQKTENGDARLYQGFRQLMGDIEKQRQFLNNPKAALLLTDHFRRYTKPAETNHFLAAFWNCWQKRKTIDSLTPTGYYNLGLIGLYLEQYETAFSDLQEAVMSASFPQAKTAFAIACFLGGSREIALQLLKDMVTTQSEITPEAADLLQILQPLDYYLRNCPLVYQDGMGIGVDLDKEGLLKLKKWFVGFDNPYYVNCPSQINNWKRVTDNFLTSLQWTQPAQRKSFLKALKQLAMLSQDLSSFVEPPIEQCRYLFKAFVEGGLLSAQFLQGWEYFAKRDLKTAEMWFSKVAQNGYQKGLLGLAEVAFERKQYQKSINILLSVVDQFDRKLAGPLSECFFHTKDFASCLKWLRIAASQGDQKAIANVWTFYQSILPLDQEMADQFLKLGEEYGNIDCLLKTSRELSQQGKVQEVFHLLAKHIKAGNARALDILNDLGTAHYKEHDVKGAHQFWLLGAKNHSLNCLLNLANLYVSWGDFDKALKLYRRAVQFGFDVK